MALNPAIPSLFHELVVFVKDSSAALHERLAASVNIQKKSRSRSIIGGDRAKTVNDNTRLFLLLLLLLLLDESISRDASASIAFPTPPHRCGLDQCAGSWRWTC